LDLGGGEGGGGNANFADALFFKNVKQCCGQCLVKNYNNDSIVSVDMDRIGVMVAYF